MRRAAKRSEALVSSENGPTAEQLRHSPVERPDRAIADAQGAASRPYRALDTPAVRDRGAWISPGMGRAGGVSRARFAGAHLDPLRALVFPRLRLGDPPPRGGDEGPVLRI